MLDFIVDESLCIKCGQCVKECPVGIIDLNDFPTILPEKEVECLKCQHCLAICPTGALSILGKDPSKSVANSKILPDSGKMAEMIKMRRSTRRYKNEEVSKDLIMEMLETASYAPSGHNKNSVHFTVVTNVQIMNLFREKVYNSIKSASDNGTLSSSLSFLLDFQRLWVSKGIDILFRGAPHLVIASAPKNIATPIQDCIIALSYFELLANSHGLGTLWNGMVKWVIEDIDPELKSLLGVSNDHLIGYVMAFGKPEAKFVRAIQSDGIHVKEVVF